MLLLINQFFYPSSAATSQFATDLAAHLAQEGHSVGVICGRSDYGGSNANVLCGITVHRVPNLPFGRSRLGRLLSYSSFYAGAMCGGLASLRAETVLTLTTPPLLSVVGTVIKKIRKTRHFIWEMDVYPDAGVHIGVFSRSGFITRIIGALADWSRHNADDIITLGEDMKDLLLARGIPAEKITVCENWADSNEIVPRPFPCGTFNILYSGNFGFAHDIDTIQHWVALPSAREFNLSVCGAGPRRAAFEAFCREYNLTNVEFRGYCPRSEIGATLAQGHVGLVTQGRRVIGSVVPSKVYGIMAAGRPVLYIGPRETTPARIIQRFDCGWHIEPGDVAGLTSLLERLNQNRELVYAAGQHARRAFLENYDRSLGVARVARVILRPPLHRSEHELSAAVGNGTSDDAIST